MTHEERIIAALRGEPLDKLPFVPRLDLWYKGSRAAGTLPDRYRHASLIDIVDDLGLGYHCVVPDFSTFEDPEDPADVGLGIHRTKSVFYTVDFDVERIVRVDGPETTTIYHTPYGDLTTRVYYDEKMKRDGVTQAHITEPAVATPDDYPKVGYIFSRGSVRPRYHYYDAIKSMVGDRGPVVGFHHESGSPMHIIQRELTKFDDFWYDMFDIPDVLEETCSQIQPLYNRILEVMAQSPCDILYVGANYDAMTTNPTFFREHITPSLRASAAFLHSRGKMLLTHTDGENQGLLEEYVEANVDVVDSVCPSPMTKLSLGETRDALGSQVSVWGGIASVSLLKDAMSERDFEAYVDKTLEELGDGRNLVLSVADSTPPGASFDRLLTLIKRIDSFGPVK